MAVGGPYGLLGDLLHRETFLGGFQVVGDGLDGNGGADLPTVLTAHAIREDRGTQGFFHLPGIFVVRASAAGIGRTEPLHCGPPCNVARTLVSAASRFVSTLFASFRI